MQDLSPESIAVNRIELGIADEKNLTLDVLRLDKIHPLISGNKWFKLKYHLRNAKDKGKGHIVTFGGAYSNHIIATAAAGKLFGFETTGIIRGMEQITRSHTLAAAAGLGMKLFFVSRGDFASRTWPRDLTEHRDVYLIYEGGFGECGVAGAAEILNYCRQEQYTHIACAVGSATTMAGLIRAALPRQTVLGVSVVKDNGGIQRNLSTLIGHDRASSFQIINDYHFGGYAKHPWELTNFMNDFYTSALIPSDFVYTGKLFFGIVDMVGHNCFPRYSKVLVIHSGGLQGNQSLPEGTLVF